MHSQLWLIFFLLKFNSSLANIQSKWYTLKYFHSTDKSQSHYKKLKMFVKIMRKGGRTMMLTKQQLSNWLTKRHAHKFLSKKKIYFVIVLVFGVVVNIKWKLRVRENKINFSNMARKETQFSSCSSISPTMISLSSRRATDDDSNSIRNSTSVLLSRVSKRERE